MKKFWQIFKERTGEWSGMRFICVLGIATIIGVWAFISIITMKVQDIPVGVVAVAIAFITGKVVQKQMEVSHEPTPVGQSESGDDSPAAI